MNYLFFLLTFLFSLNIYAETETTLTEKKPNIIQKAGLRLKQIWYEGSNEIYFSGYAWHNRFTYSKEKIDTFNEKAWGGGLGKGFYDEDGDWHALSAIAFQDSHKNIQPVVGYTFLKILNLSKDLKLGGGYVAIITARPDINHGVPFPGALPWASITYKKLAISATYIPGAKGAGNVLFILGKWTL